MACAHAAQKAGAQMLRGGAFKPRTSPYDFQGLKEDGLKLLAKARAETGLRVITEVMSSDTVDLVAEYTDVLQVGARNMQNFSLLEVLGDQRKPVLLKRGLSGTIKELLMAAEYIASRGNYQIMLCERGIRTFETATRNTLDLSAVPVLQSLTHLPIIVDHKVVAVFNVAFTGPIHASDDIVRVFSALVNRAAISIANMELFEQTKDLAVMEERNRLARDLHDSAKQKAFAALAQLGTARGVLNGNGHLVSPHLNEAENLVADVIQELTFLVQEIYPIALQEKGLATTLREYIYEWENRNDAKVNFSARNERRLSLEIEQALYRVTQEALANVARHSQARRVDLALVYNGDSMQLSLSDDGQGFDMNNGKANGMGLRSIRERISSIRGTVQIQSAPGRGTRLIVQVPTKG